jgi:3-deoxy-D-manno-octulosonate 8-phosphate phosphatase (KDO 8-P phosphatase)
MKSYKELLPGIKVFMFDVDGVFTNGDVILFQGEVVRFLNSGMVMRCNMQQKWATLYLSLQEVIQRCKTEVRKLGSNKVYLGSANKLEVLKK